MKENGFDVNSIDDILSKGFGLEVENVEEVDNSEELDEELDNTNEENSEENDSNKSIDAEDNDNSEETNEETNDELTEDNSKTDKKSNQKEYNFKKMRTDNANLQKSIDDLKMYKDFVESLATNNNYADLTKFMEDVNEASLEKEAKTKGVDPELFKQNRTLSKRIEDLEKENLKKDLDRKTDIFLDNVDEAVKKYNLGENGREEIFNRLANNGLELNYVLNSPNSKILIDGILTDKISHNVEKTIVEKSKKLDNLSESANSGNGTEKKVTLEELIAKDMKDYKERFF